MTEIDAYHESGHVFMAMHVGAQVESASIEPDWDDGPSRSGDVRINWPLAEFTERELHECMVKVALAGPAAEMIYSGDPFHPGHVREWAMDWRQAQEAAATWISDSQKRFQYLEQTSIEIYRFFSRDEHWAILAMIADHLEAHETLDAEQLSEIFSDWTG